MRDLLNTAPRPAFLLSKDRACSTLLLLRTAASRAHTPSRMCLPLPQNRIDTARREGGPRAPIFTSPTHRVRRVPASSHLTLSSYVTFSAEFGRGTFGPTELSILAFAATPCCWPIRFLSIRGTPTSPSRSNWGTLCTRTRPWAASG